MKKLLYQHWHIEVDVDATRSAYAAIEKSDSESCTCDMCRNFLAQRSDAYSPEIRAFFSELGVDADKELCNSSYADGEKETYFLVHCFVGTIAPDALRTRHAELRQMLAEAAKEYDANRRGVLVAEFEEASNTVDPLDASPVDFHVGAICGIDFPLPCVSTSISIALPWVVGHR
jgi:hypothetical protein